MYDCLISFLTVFDEHTTYAGMVFAFVLLVILQPLLRNGGHDLNLLNCLTSILTITCEGVCS